MASANGNGLKAAANGNGKSVNKSVPAATRAKPWQFAAGHDPRRGRGCKKGAPNAGRTPEKFKEFCRELLASKDADAAVDAIMKDKSHPAYAAMWKAVSDRGYGKPTQAVEVSGNINVNVQDARERIARRIDRLALTN